MRNKEILPFATTWMALESILLSEISQRKTNTIRSYLDMESKKSPTHRSQKQICGWQGVGVEVGVEMDEASQKV